MDKEKSQRFMQKVVSDAGTALAAGLVIVGQQTGLFKAMAQGDWMGSASLVQKTSLHPRYVEEWLGAMVVNGYVELDERGDRYRLPPEHALFLTDEQSEFHLGGLFTGLPGLLATVPKLVTAFREGKGLAFTEFGDTMPVALEQMNRPVYEKRLATVWLPAMNGVVERLNQGGRAIDIGCGTGIVPITLARAFPAARIEGLDMDARSIDLARANARDAGVAERVEFIRASADSLETSNYDLITTFDVIHDLPDPLAMLRKIRSSLAPTGRYLMVEPRMAHDLAENQTPFGKLLYGMSCLHCVPQSLAQGGPGLGACWGPQRARDLAREAGFEQFEALPIRSPALAFYELAA